MNRWVGFLGVLVVIGVIVLLVSSFIGSNVSLAQGETQVAALQAEIKQLQRDKAALQGLAYLIAYETNLSSRSEAIPINREAVQQAILDPGVMEVTTDGAQITVTVRNWYPAASSDDRLHWMHVTFQFDPTKPSVWPHWSAKGDPYRPLTPDR